jgi:hypothetical protein
MSNEKIVKDAAKLWKKHHAGVGKIARLPADLREEINLRLHNGNKGREILDRRMVDDTSVQEIGTFSTSEKH